MSAVVSTLRYQYDRLRAARIVVQLLAEKGCVSPIRLWTGKLFYSRWFGLGDLLLFGLASISLQDGIAFNKIAVSCTK